MNSNFHIAQAPFTSIIHSIWQIDRATDFQNEYIIPKGVIEVIFNFSETASIPAEISGRPYQLSKCFISGFNTQPIQLALPEKQVFFGVLLQPLAVKKLFGMPAREFSDVLVDLTLLDPTFHSLWHQLADQGSFDERVRVFLKWIGKKFPEWQAREQMINGFLSGIDQHDQSVSSLARSLCYSPRQLSRKLVEATGMNTEEMLLYKKYLHALHLIHHTNLSLTAIAYKSNFSDQSHFIRAFRAYSKITPGVYKRNKAHVVGHLLENVR